MKHHVNPTRSPDQPYPSGTAPDEAFAAARSAALQEILDDSTQRKVIAAGPGCGKTFTFRQVLDGLAGRALIFTFLRNLVEDLEKSFGNDADVFSFHGYAKHQLYSLAVEGFREKTDYYPGMDVLYEADLFVTDTLLDDAPVSRDDIADAFMNLHEEGEVLPAVLRSGKYYSAVGHTDSVYRVFLALRSDTRGIPIYPQILVDEYQDFSLMETELIRLLATASPTLVVGDDDQALYGFRHASPKFIRGLVKDADYKTFELPYCTRCTPVLVDAVHRVVAGAKSSGLLAERIDKPYLCYMPDKKQDANRYPKIVHAYCSTDTKQFRFMARYIKACISTIDPQEVSESRKEGYPTVLIIGKKHYTDRIREDLTKAGLSVTARVPPKLSIRALDGYRRIASKPKSRLGWRILVHCHMPEGWEKWVAKAVLNDVELYDLIEATYRARQLKIAQVVGKLMNGEAITNEEQTAVEAATSFSTEEILQQLTGVADEPAEQEVDSESVEGPTVMVTNLVGSKGLQAQHVFLVGVSEGTLPRQNNQVETQEVCEFLVGLTRARKSCTLVSCKYFNGGKQERSIFIRWLGQLVQEQWVDKEHLTKIGA